MIATLYSSLAIPDSCRLGKRVFKKLFHEHATLGVTDKKALREDIDTITWVYTLKPNTIPIHAYRDEEREYDEVAVLQVDLKTLKRTGRIAEIVHRAIPYPLVVVFAFGATCAISLASKRFSQAEKEAIVADDFVMTSWIDLTKLSPLQQAFLDSLAITQLPQTNFSALYAALMDRVIALDCARLSGEYRIRTTVEDRERRRQRLAKCHELETQITDARAMAKRQKQIHRLADLNVEIKRLEDRLAELANEL